MSDNVVLRNILGTKREELTDWRRLHNEELHNMYPHIKYDENYEIEMDETGEACIRYGSEDVRVHVELWWINLKGRGHLEVLGVDVIISHKLDIRK